MFKMKTYSLDLETRLASEEFLFPEPICLSWVCHEDPTDSGVAGNNGDMQDKLKWFFDQNIVQVWANGYGFDLPVLWTWYPQLRSKIIEALDGDRVRDVQIRERLYDLSTIGRIKDKGYSLSALTKKYTGKDIEFTKTGPDIWRLRYAELDKLSVKDYPEAAIKYALDDVINLKDVYLAQEKLKQPNGYGSINTESLQIKAGFALALANSVGLPIDIDKLKDFEYNIDGQLEPLRKLLIETGYAKITPKGKFLKQDKLFAQYLEANYKDYLHYTAPSKTFPEGKIAITEEALNDMPPDPIIDARKKYTLLEKYKSTYCKNIRNSYKGLFRGIRDKNGFYKGYDILKETGRTSGFIQTMPREGGIREMFVAPPGYKIVTIDFAAIEACSMAQCYKDLGLGTTLIDYLNKGKSPQDYHCLLGHLWYAYENGTKPNLQKFIELKNTGDKKAKESRNKSKPGGLSISGGVGNETMVKIAKGSDVEITIEEADIFRQFAYSQMPEVKLFLKEWVPKQLLSGDYHYAYAYECNGRYRNRCTYCACANGRSMQSPAADGAKESIWECFKICHGLESCKFVAFIHDELIFFVKDDKDLEPTTLLLSAAMCKGMKKILKDVRITVEWGIMDRWSKDETTHIKRGKYWIN